MKILRPVVRGALFAAAAYSGFAAFTWFRYGRNKTKPVSPSLDRFMPDPEVIEQHSIGVHAPAAIAFDACCKYDMTQSSFAQFLFDARACALGAKPTHPPASRGLVETFKEIGWCVLDETLGQEIVFGAVAQPWLADAGFRTIPSAEFRTFNEPGWVKIAFTLSAEPAGASSSVVRTETRVITTDADARKRFRTYWSLVRPGVELIRIILLRGVKANAEAVASAVVAA